MHHKHTLWESIDNLVWDHFAEGRNDSDIEVICCNLSSQDTPIAFLAFIRLLKVALEGDWHLILLQKLVKIVKREAAILGDRWTQNTDPRLKTWTSSQN